MKKEISFFKKSKLNLPIILFIAFVDYLGIGLVFPIFGFLLFDTSHPIVPFDSSPEYRGAILGLLIGLTPLCQFFCSPLLGSFSDIKGRKIALIVGISVGSFGYLLGVLGVYFNSLTLLFLHRIFVGASDSTAGVAQATIADISTEKNKTKRFAYMNASLGVGFTLGPLLGSFTADPAIVSWFSYSTPIALAGLMTLVNLFLVGCLFSETKSKLVNIRLSFIEGLNNIQKIFFLKGFRWLILGWFFLSFGWAIFNEFAPVLLHYRFDFTLNNIGGYYAFTGCCYALGALISAHFIDKFMPEKVAIFSLLFAASCMLAFILVNDFFYLWCIIPFMMFSLTLVSLTATTLVSNRASVETQGEVLGMFQSVGAAAMGLSPLFLGTAIGAFPELTGFGGSVCLIISSFGFWMGVNPNILQAAGDNLETAVSRLKPDLHPKSRLNLGELDKLPDE